jgi:hypothetical protein
VAKLHNKAGQSHKLRYRQHADRFLIGMGVIMFAMGALFGAVFSNLQHTAVALTLMASAVLLYFLATRVSEMWDRMWTERVSYLRGGQAEGFVAWVLYYLPDGWHVFNNLMIRPDQDLDHVVVGPGGLFAVSTKGCRGLLSAMPGGQLHLNNEPTDFGNDALHQAMRLRDLLSEKLGGQSVPYVNAILAAPLAYTRLINPVKNVTVLHQYDLTETLEKMPKRLSPAEIKRIVAALETFPVAGDKRAKAAATAAPAHD